LRAGDVVVLRQSQEHVEGEIITVLGAGRYKVRWLTGADYQNRVTTVATEEVRKK
jgi:translation initiation factor IF-1